MTKLRVHPLTAALWAAGLLAAGAAKADEANINYKISGFGTIALTSTSAHDLQFRSSLNQSVGANNTPDLGVDSHFGLQGVVNFSPDLSLTAQMLALRRRVDATATSNREFDPGIEWLMVKYAPSSNLDLRMGRVVLPAFMISDSRNVGYAQPWLRAPLDVYAQMPLTTVDGAQATWRIPVAQGTFSLQPTFGKSTSNTASGSNTAAGQRTIVPEGDPSTVVGLTATFEYGDWLARIGQVHSKINNASYDVLGIGVPVVFTMEDKFTSLGLQYDNGKAVVMAELAVRRMNNMPDTGPASYTGIAAGPSITMETIYEMMVGGKPLAKTQHWYVAGGWRFGKLLPMIAVGQTTDQKADPQTSTRSLDVSLRYDLMPNVALKGQIGRYDSRNVMAFVMPTQADDKRTVTVASFGLDFVF
jgi:hypothetical protein